MLRLVFCFGIILFGIGASFVSPFNALLFYLWNAYFRPEDWSYFGVIGAMNLSWLIGIYLVGSTLMSRPTFPLNWRVGLMLLFVLQTMLGVVTSEHIAWSWNSWIVFAKVLVVAYLIVVLATDRRRYRWLLLVIAFSLSFEAAKQGWAQLFVNPGGVNNNPISFLGDNNGVALGLMMIVPVLGALAQTAPTKTEAWLHRFVLVGVFMRAITTYSRGGFLGALILGLVGFFRSGKKIRYVIAAGVLSLVVYSVMPESFWNRISTITATDENRDESANGRLHFWGVGLQMAYAKPLTGVGFNGFTPSYESYNTDGEFGGERAVHSVWFGVLADLGFPGLLLFLSTWSGAMWTCWRVSAACKRDPERNDVRLYANALLSSLTVFAAAGTFLSVQYGEMFWHFVCMATALAPLANEAVAPVQQNATSGRPRVARDPAMAQL